MRRLPATAGVVVFVVGCGLELSGTLGGTTMLDAGAEDAPLESGVEPFPTPDGTAPTIDGDISVTVVKPSHVDDPIDPSAPDLIGVESIDTTTRAIKLRVGQLPVGLRFIDRGGRSVLFVAKWNVDGPVTVRGSAPLIVLAANVVEIGALVDASAVKEAPGPGGALPTVGAGAGGNAIPSGTDDPGGGGAGFGVAGAAGGNGISAAGAKGGSAYGALITDFAGGSGGGRGSPYAVSPCTTHGNGGGGGGALQITSRLTISVAAAGTITASGGGGRGGCLNGSNSTMSGGGGGAGGTIFLESPTISISGALVANGGSGGGGGQAGSSTAGSDGSDGLLALTPAPGGAAPTTDRRGGPGGARDAPPMQPTAGINNAGGGGGAYGRIWLRTRKTSASVTGNTVSPTPALETSL